MRTDPPIVPLARSISLDAFACGDLLARKEVDVNEPNFAVYASTVGATTEELRQ
jgi:hypothetical protein